MLRARALQDLEQDTGNNTFITLDVQSDLIIPYKLKGISSRRIFCLFLDLVIFDSFQYKFNCL